MLSTGLLLATAFGHVLGLPQIYSRDNELRTHLGDDMIQWSTNCSYLGFESDLPYSCANFTVPLDYSNPKSNNTLTLTLTKIDAVKQPARGSVLFNPGGPGAGGADMITSFGEEFMTVLGGEFNLIGFDPRGTANTLRFDCYDNSDMDRALLAPPDNTLGNASDTALGQNLAYAEVAASQCLDAAADIGGLLGTSFVARDMARIVDALGEDGLLRYWGFSYGTALGATFSAMFPEKVDKVVLDGNVNVHEYYSGEEIESLDSLDSVVQGFYDGCVANPDECALAKEGQTSQDISNVVEAFLATLRYNPIVVTDEISIIITYDKVKTFMFESMYRPNSWPTVAVLLDLLIQGNSTGYADTLEQLAGGGNGTDREAPDAFKGIRCGDVAFRADTLSAFDSFKEAVVPTSKWGGLDLGLDNIMQCAPWKMRAKEVYSGSWSNIRTKNPLLIIGNTYDPVTPLVSARNNSAAFEGSIVLQHNGYGHCSIAQPSLCSAKYVQAYFENGTLPAPGTICEVDVPLFSDETWANAFSPISLNGTSAGMVKRSVEDSALLKAMTGLSRSPARYGRAQ